MAEQVESLYFIYYYDVNEFKSPVIGHIVDRISASNINDANRKFLQNNEDYLKKNGGFINVTYGNRNRGISFNDENVLKGNLL
jgi:hypothetical protein